jgi:RimJ/RimL family protein N-acetyltransferase
MPTLVGKKVRLRVVEKKDIPNILKWFNDPEVIQYLQFYLPLTEEMEVKWLERVNTSGNDIVFVIEAVAEDGKFKPIGTCGLHEINWKDRKATAGIAIGEKEFWNGGRGTEAASLLVEYAFCQLNLNRIGSSVYDFNERSLAMQKKIGFQIEGRRRQAVFKNNRYADEIILGLLKKKWKRVVK